ncbi:hypothetical protein K432DRAFT_402327 [Lepidopterella palustris CBS 459.81]|uniref:Uncharacterized protein n=1 Tax=Lepidopterella palustris CBS 459.81 TaxID=1314670 RepID=A0A8E2EFX0_9PEZI|nr:hypothetical protein K432DRAFT_402327 [Lepidopterella palustris CBS 459.81]
MAHVSKTLRTAPEDPILKSLPAYPITFIKSKPSSATWSKISQKPWIEAVIGCSIQLPGSLTFLLSLWFNFPSISMVLPELPGFFVRISGSRLTIFRHEGMRLPVYDIESIYTPNDTQNDLFVNIIQLGHSSAEAFMFNFSAEFISSKLNSTASSASHHKLQVT